ncbi:MAG: hypothetical protein U0Q16_30465 [Bryobacteraceae bacterium]
MTGRCAVFAVAAATVANLAAADPARDARWRQDLTYLSTELPKRHPNLFFQTSRADFERAAADLDSKIPDMLDSEIVVGFSRLVAMAGDGHTAIRRLPFVPLPLTLDWFEDGLVVRVAPVEFRRAIGGRVVAIGGIPIADVHKRVAAAISHETASGLLADSPRYMTMAEVLHAAGVSAQPGGATYTIEDREGDRFDMELVRGPFPEMVEAPVYGSRYAPRTTRNATRNYWVEFLPATGVVYFAYNVCGEEPGRPFNLVIREAMALLDTHPGSKLVFDVRNNSGGNAAVIAPLVAELQSRKAALKDNLFVLTSRKTFSAGVAAAVDFADKLGAVVIGEMTGGLVNGTGNVAQFTLPVSKIEVQHATAFFTKRPIEGPLLPDVRVARWSGDFFAAYDAELGAVLNHPVRSEPAPEDGAISVTNALSGKPLLAPGLAARIAGDFGDSEGLAVLVDGARTPWVEISLRAILFPVPQSATPGISKVEIMRGEDKLAETFMAVAESSPGISAVSFAGRKLEIPTSSTIDKVVHVWIGEEEVPVESREIQRWFVAAEKLLVDVSGSSRTGPYPVTVVVDGVVSNAVTATF